MSLVDDYLRAVALLLPKDKREDIIDELRELILSRIENREAELGRALTDDETEEVLRQLGHPLVVASRYRDGPQHVVGPALYPFWMFAVRAAVTMQLAVAVVIFIVRAATGDVTRALGQAVASGFTGAMILVGLATLAAWLIERDVIRIPHFDRWRVRDLRFLGFAAWDAEVWSQWLHGRHDGVHAWSRDRQDRRGRRAAFRDASAASSASAASRPVKQGPPEPPSARAEVRDAYGWGRSTRTGYGRGYRYGYRGRSPVGRGLGGIAGGVVLLLWWVGALHFGIAADAADLRSLGLEPGALATVDWAGIKAALYLPVLAYVGLIVTQGVVRIAHPDARRVHGLIDLAVAAVILGTVGWLWTLSPIAAAVRVETLAAFAQRMRDAFEPGPPFPLAPMLTLLLVIVAFGGVIRAVQGLFELILPSPAPWPPMMANGLA